MDEQPLEDSSCDESGSSECCFVFCPEKDDEKFNQELNIAALPAQRGIFAMIAPFVLK